MQRKLASLLLSLALLSLACLQTALIVESVPAEAVPTGTPTEIASGAVWTALPSQMAAESTCAVVVAVRSLHLREDADYNSVSLAYMWNGEEVQVLDGGDSSWWKVKHGYTVGYARSKYLLVVECE